MQVMRLPFANKKMSLVTSDDAVSDLTVGTCIGVHCCQLGEKHKHTKGVQTLPVHMKWVLTHFDQWISRTFP